MIDSVFFAGGIVTVGSFIIMLLGAAWYDVQTTTWQRRLKAHPGLRQFRRRPYVTIVLAHHGNWDATKNSLKSLMKLSYRKREIILMGASGKHLSDIFEHKNLRSVKNQDWVGLGRGELIIKIDGGVLLQQDSLTKAVLQLNKTPTATGVVFALKPHFYPSHTHLIWTYQQFGTALLQKLFSIVGLLKSQTSAPTVWRRPFLVQTSRHFLAYADDALFSPSPTSHFYMLLKMQQLEKSQNPISFLLGAASFTAISYSLYMAIWLHQPTLLLLTLLYFSFLTLATIWWNNHMSLRQKSGYILLLPLAYGYGYCMLTRMLLEMLTDMAKAVLPVSISLFVWIKNILRIVE
jgi:hypothetical protein